jgi:hypothetical protein
LDYFVDISKNDLIGWDAKGPSWRAVKSMTFHDRIGTSSLFPYSQSCYELQATTSFPVPTVDNSVRNSFVVDALLKIKRNVFLVGATGTGMEDCVGLAQRLLRDSPHTHSQLAFEFLGGNHLFRCSRYW